MCLFVVLFWGFLFEFVCFLGVGGGGGEKVKWPSM